MYLLLSTIYKNHELLKVAQNVEETLKGLLQNLMLCHVCNVPASLHHVVQEENLVLRICTK